MTSKEYKDLKKELDELKSSVDEQNATLQRIHTAIVGDNQFGQEGLVRIVNKHAKWIEAQKYLWAKIFGGIAVGSTIVSFALKFLI